MIFFHHILPPNMIKTCQTYEGKYCVFSLKQCWDGTTARVQYDGAVFFCGIWIDVWKKSTSSLKLLYLW